MSDRPEAAEPLAALADRVARFTVHFGATDGASASEVILVPPGADLHLGFERARRRRAAGARVHLVGLGITFPTSWPDWIAHEDGLTLSEIDAYAQRPLFTVTEELRGEIHRWLEELFEGLFPVSAAGIFYGALAERLLQGYIESLPIARGLAALHGNAKLSCVDETWSGWRQTRRLLGLPSPRPSLAQRRPLWPLALGALTALAGAGTLVTPIRSFLASRSSRVKLRAHREIVEDTAPPKVWFALIPDWLRINLHLLDSAVLPELDRGGRVGVLLINSLHPGRRDEARLRVQHDAEIWPGLGRLNERLGQCAVDQAVGPESLAQLLGDTRAWVARSARLLGRLLLLPGRLERGPLCLDLGAHPADVAKLLTVDVARVSAALAATERALARHRLGGTDVIFAASTRAESSVVDLSLQRAGARTIEFVHGTGGATWTLGYGESPSTVKCLWSRADAALPSDRNQLKIVAGMPVRVRPKAPRSGTSTRNVLFLSNYVHRDSRVGDRLPFEPFQAELLSATTVLRKATPTPLAIRWRPHPADDRRAVESSLRRCHDVHLSQSPSLEEDLEWSELVVTSSSTAAYEALFAGVPVYLHVTAALADVPAAMVFDPKRRFRTAAELALPFAECVSGLERGDPLVLEPERAARRALFGDGERPISLGEALDSLPPIETDLRSLSVARARSS